MSVIYEPKGAAAEYSHLAVNLYKGCAFKCIYCYAPAIARMTLDEWSANPQPKDNILERLEKDAKKMAGDPRTILLCYTSDPYQSGEAAALTRQALLILERFGMTVTVLTKSGMAGAYDFDILARNKWQFGTTVSTLNDTERFKWEPHASRLSSRLKAIALATKVYGIKTWVSMEPIYDTKGALDLIQAWANIVDFWKIGKMNHRKLDIDWAKFLFDATELCDRLGLDYYIKKELAAFGRIMTNG